MKWPTDFRGEHYDTKKGWKLTNPHSPLLTPIRHSRNWPQIPLCDRISPAFNTRQMQNCFLNIRR